jgi:hypothetical protein
LNRFILALLISSSAIYGTTFLLHQSGFLESFPSYFWPTLIFLNFSTLLIYFYLLRAGDNSFVQLYLLTMVIKLLAYCAYNIVIILRDRENAGINVGFFLIAYLLLTTLELAFLYRRIGR